MLEGNFLGLPARGIERGPRRNQTPMRTQKYRITTRSARDHFNRCAIGNRFELGTIETPYNENIRHRNQL